MSVEVKAQHDTALASVKAIYDAAAQATTLLGQMQAAAQEASTTLTAIYADAENAKTWANGALAGLSTLESLIDTVQWIADHKKASTDVTVDSTKTYYTYDSTTGTLSKVEPEGTENPSSLGWYELDEAITNYIASRLVEANEGLYVADIGNGWKVLVASGAVQAYPAGVHIVDPNGNIVNSNTAAGIRFSSDNDQYIGGENAYITFDADSGTLQIGGSSVVFTGDTPLSKIIEQVENADADLNGGYSIAVEYTGTPDDDNTTIDLNTLINAFEENVPATAEFTFDGTDWYYDGSAVDLADYGIAIDATCVNGDAISIDFTYVDGVNDLRAINEVAKVTDGALEITTSLRIGDMELFELNGGIAARRWN